MELSLENLYVDIGTWTRNCLSLLQKSQLHKFLLKVRRSAPHLFLLSAVQMYKFLYSLFHLHVPGYITNQFNDQLLVGLPAQSTVPKEMATGTFTHIS